MSYLKVNCANFIKEVGVNPIYECNGKYYVGIESFCGIGEPIEGCIDCDTLEEAEKVCMELPQPN